jgi:transcriptional regulator with XRE-family HTH domain
MFDHDSMKARRLELGLSVPEALLRAGWTAAQRTYWYDLERGRKPNPCLRTVCMVAAALDLSPSDLISPLAAPLAI